MYGICSYIYRPSLKLTVRTWKWMVGILDSFWDGPISGAMLVSGRVPWFSLQIKQLQVNIPYMDPMFNLLSMNVFLAVRAEGRQSYAFIESSWRCNYFKRMLLRHLEVIFYGFYYDGKSPSFASIWDNIYRSFFSQHLKSKLSESWYQENIPKASMGLVYLPRFAIKINQFM